MSCLWSTFQAAPWTYMTWFLVLCFATTLPEKIKRSTNFLKHLTKKSWVCAMKFCVQVYAFWTPRKRFLMNMFDTWKEPWPGSVAIFLSASLAWVYKCAGISDVVLFWCFQEYLLNILTILYLMWNVYFRYKDIRGQTNLAHWLHCLFLFKKLSSL